MKIEDNFLDQEEFDGLQNVIMGGEFSWFYSNVIDYQDDEDKYQFIHFFYKKYFPVSPLTETIRPIVEIINPVSIYRIKANLITRTPNIIENTFHVDVGNVSEEKLKHMTTSIFYMNTNNGYTEFEDSTKIECIANRMITFPANMKHRGTSCTDEKRRVVINFNYFK